MDLNIRILKTTMRMLQQLGVSSTTMDAIAKECGISKRTLYEHFPDKLTLITEALKYNNTQCKLQLEQIFRESSNQLDALLKTYTEVRKQVSTTSAALRNDINRMYPSLRSEYQKIQTQNNKALLEILKQGQEEDMIRTDTELEISVNLFALALRNPELSQMANQNNIPLVKVLDTLFINFLRSIASKKGMVYIDTFIKSNITDYNIII